MERNQWMANGLMNLRGHSFWGTSVRSTVPKRWLEYIKKRKEEMWPLLASGFSSTVLWPPASETELQHQQWVWHLGIFPPLLFPSSKSQGGRARGWRVSSSLPTTTPVSSRESAFRTSSIGPKTIKNKQNAGRFFFPAVHDLLLAPLLQNNCGDKMWK